MCRQAKRPGPFWPAAGGTPPRRALSSRAKAQADAQELKNAREDGVVLETELFTFILQRVAQEISGILVRVPLTLQRKYPDISPSHLDVVKTEIAKASNVAAKAGENVGGWIDDFRRAEGS